jgi:hypothetical protein
MKAEIYLETKTRSIGQFPLPSDRQDLSLKVMVIGHVFLDDIPSLKKEKKTY